MAKRGESAISGKKSSHKKSSKHVHEMRIRHTANGGYIAAHHPKPGAEGPPDPEEHGVPDLASLQEHVGQHMAPEGDMGQPAPPSGGMPGM